MSKGKVLVAVLAILAVPAVGYGQWTASMNVDLDKSQVLPGESFSLGIILNSDQSIGGVQWQLSASGPGDQSNLFVTEGQRGELFSDSDQNKFLNVEFVSTYAAGAGMGTVNPELIFKFFGEAGQTDLGIFPGGLLAYNVDVPVGMTPGLYDISLTDTILTNSAVEATLIPDVIGARIEVLPEPTSALLLLAAVPFLRRRRTA